MLPDGHKLDGTAGTSAGAFFRGLLWTLLGIFLIAFHQLCIIPGLLDYSIYGFILLIAGTAGLLLILPEDWRRQAVSFLLAVLFAYEAQSSVALWPLPGRLVVFAAIFVVVLTVARVYGHLNRAQLAAVVLASLLVFAVGPKAEIRLYSNFTLRWESPKLYANEIFPYFPLRADDFTGDGTAEILTWGNRAETPDAEDLEDEPGKPGEPDILQPEEIYPYLFSWEGGGLNRVPLSQIPPQASQRAERLMDAHYPGFPYYSGGAGRIEPLTTPERLAAEVMRFSSAPLTAVNLAAQTIDARESDHWDRAEFPQAGFDEVILRENEVHIRSRGVKESAPSEATQIIGPVRTESEDNLLALLGPTLQLVKVAQRDAQQPTAVEVTHSMGEEDFDEPGLLDILIADVDGDGADELLLSSRHDPARILKPLPGGDWQVLWMAETDDQVFRFEDVVNDGQPEIIAFRPSLVRDDPHRYLTGYHFTDGGLEPTWRSMINLVDVRGGDVTGDGRTELVGLLWGEHRFWVLEPHGLPVTPFLWTAAALLASVGLFFRLRGLPTPERHRLLVAAAALAAGAVVIWAFQIVPLHTYRGAESDPLTQTSTAEQAGEDAPQFARLLDDSVADSEAQQKFWYSGWIASFVGKRQINSMYDGTVHLPDGYVSNMRVVGNPLRLFRRDEHTFLEEADNIFEGETAGEVPRPFIGLLNLLEEPDRFTAVGPESIMGIPCWTYEATFSLPEWMKLMSEGEKLPAEGGAQPLLKRGTVHAQIWIGQDEPFIHQYVTTIRLPLAGAGQTKQEVLFRFYRYGDENIQPVDVERLRGYLQEQ